MDQKQIFLPESMYKVDSEMTYERLSDLYESGQTVTGTVTRLNSKDELLEVYLGENLTGIMPFASSTIYPLYRYGGISPNIYELVGKNIQAKIKCIDGNKIFLSRRENMLNALELLRDKTDKIEYTSIIGFSKSSAFIDMGAGIIGRIRSKAFSPVKFRDIRDVGIKVGDIISAKITEFLEEDNKFELSRVDILPSHYEVFNPNDVVVCKVFEPVCDLGNIGYYVLINNNYCGIVDSPKVKLNYGDNIIGYIKKLKDEGIKLTLVETL